MDANREDLAVSWDDLRLFLAVARQRSLLAAGRELGIATSTLSRRMTRLEAEVGRKLLERRPDGIRLTDAGESLAETANRMSVDLSSSLRRLPGGAKTLSGTIRVTSGDGFSDIVAEAVAAFSSMHPEVRFEIATDAQTVDLARGAADLAVRTLHRRESSLSYRLVGTLRYGLYASPAYARRNGLPSSTGELASHPCIGFSPPLHRVAMMRWFTSRGVKRFAIRTNTYRAYFASVRSGAGIGALPDYHSHGLERVLPSLPLDPVPIFLCSRAERRRLPHLEAFAQFLGARIELELARPLDPSRGLQ
jgi:DNA-binding transcriptional LysR family regulator